MSDLKNQIIHSLRMRGWSRIEAECRADEIVNRAALASVDRSPEGQDAKRLDAQHESAVPPTAADARAQPVEE